MLLNSLDSKIIDQSTNIAYNIKSDQINDFISDSLYLPVWVKCVFFVYIFLSYFETYFSAYIGTSTKYVIISIVLVIAYYNRFKIGVGKYWPAFLIWFVYSCITIFWSSNVNNAVSAHFLSQLGSVIFIIILDSVSFKYDFIRLNLLGHLLCSSLFGVLSLIFHRSYIKETLLSRQVLTLFGKQNDPNNCAAFLLVGIAIAAYCVIYERRFIVINVLIIAINSFATFLTGSRAGFVGVGLIVIVFIFLPSQGEKFDLIGGIKKLAFIAVTIILVYLIVQRFMPSASLDRILDFEKYSEGSGRIEKWQGVINYYVQRPVFGYGWGGLDFSSVGYSDSAHNTYLTLLCEGGIVGLVIFMVPIIRLFRSAYRSKNVLTFIFLICGLFPSFLIDAINKKFLWNAIALAILLANYYDRHGEFVSLWKTKISESLNQEK